MIANFIKFDLEQMLPNLQLMRVDKSTMANTIEARVPYLDKELIEFSRKLPLTKEYQNNQGKEFVIRFIYILESNGFTFCQNLSSSNLALPMIAASSFSSEMHI